MLRYVNVPKDNLEMLQIVRLVIRSAKLVIQMQNHAQNVQLIELACLNAHVLLDIMIIRFKLNALNVRQLVKLAMTKLNA